MFSIVYIFKLTNIEHSVHYNGTKIMNLIKKKKRLKNNSRIKFILVKIAAFSFFSVLNENTYNNDIEIKCLNGNSNELFNVDYIFTSTKINRSDQIDAIKNKSLSQLIIKNN